MGMVGRGLDEKEGFINLKNVGVFLHCSMESYNVFSLIHGHKPFTPFFLLLCAALLLTDWDGLDDFYFEKGFHFTFTSLMMGLTLSVWIDGGPRQI